MMEPPKGILKTKKGKKSIRTSKLAMDLSKNNPSGTSKTATFDELNVLATFHPLNKDYGHMIIDEPKTPYVRDASMPNLDPEVLLEKLQKAARAQTPAFGIDESESSDDEDYPESLEEKVRRLEFERRRKAHYKEFFSVGLARRLIEEEWAEMDYTDDFSVCGESYRSDYMEECETHHIGFSQPPAPLMESPQISSDDTDNSFTSLSIDPENDPTHPCYHRLRAQMETNKSNSVPKAGEEEEGEEG